MELVFLGTGDAHGLPRLFCTCATCRAAAAGAIPTRTRPSLWVASAAGALLVDVSPDVRQQLQREALGPPDAVVLTHPHHDHCDGLGDLYDALRTIGAERPLYGTPDTLAVIGQRYPYIADRLTPTPGHSFSAGGLAVSLLWVPHGVNGHAYAALLAGEGRRILYAPDVLDWAPPPELAGVDLLVAGASFRDESGKPRRSVNDVAGALTLAEAIRARRVLLTHLSHDIDRGPLELPPWASLAADGQRLRL